MNKFCDKIVTALGSNEIDKLSNELSLNLEKRLLSLLYLHQGNPDKISMNQIQLEYLRIKNQDLLGNQLQLDFNNNDIMDCS
jgi:hypothetical protein